MDFYGIIKLLEEGNAERRRTVRLGVEHLNREWHGIRCGRSTEREIISTNDAGV
jgi:hypothetical protein